MRTPIIIGLVLAFGAGAICGVLATLGSLFLMQQQDRDRGEALHTYAKTATPVAMAADVEVWAARTDIPAGTVIDDPDRFFRSEYQASGMEPANAVTSRNQLRHKQLLRPMTANQTATLGDVGPSVLGLKPGMRAIAIAVPDSTGGFIVPGSHVDVLVARKQPDAKAEAKILLEDLLVLAINQLLPLPKPADITVTLGVTPAQAETIVEARTDGTLHLVLRGPEETKPAAVKPGNK